MKTLNDYFDQVYCINLDKRTDRWEESQEEFQKHDITAERFSALSGNDFPKDSVLGKRYRSIGLNSGQVGCAISHRELVKKIKSQELNNALILEDDVEFDTNLNEVFPTVMEEVPDDWDMLYFGGNHCGNNVWNPQSTLEQISKNIFKVTNCYATHAYAIKNTVYDKIISVWDDNVIDHVDICLSKVQAEVNCYIIRPHLAWQRPSFSDLLKQFETYDFLKQ
jgi:GR25 family glycosyltransferase involved in LPS biosynthesis